MLSEPGTRKSAVLSELLRPVLKWESHRAREMRPEIASAAQRRRLAEKRLHTLEDEIGKTKEADKRARLEAIDANPFDTLRSGSTLSKYTRYITPGEIDRVIAACPDSEWRLAFGLARHAGLRIPSESHRLTWADVDFERGRLTVRSPKTERWEGHDQRVVPITPKLMALLQERFDAMPEGEARLVTFGGSGAVIRRVRRIWAAAGVEPWARLWQTLRSSCEKEWAMTFPQYAVSRWVGHSITISGKHYANAVPDELFDRAANVAAATTPTCAQRQAQRKASETAGNGRKAGSRANGGEAQNAADLREFPLLSAPCA